MITSFLHGLTSRAARTIFGLLIIFLLLNNCATQRKASYLKKHSTKASLMLSENMDQNTFPTTDRSELKSDTMKIKTPDGRDALIMRAIKDEEGEMVATDVIQAAVVTAKFRNIAERHGKVNLQFDISIPPEMKDGKWQLKLTPLLEISKEKKKLESVVITGRQYRKTQLKGYERYEKFLASIIADEEKSIDVLQLERFIKRNMPELYKFKSDSSNVSDEVFKSNYGITEQEAIEHYKRDYIIRRKNRKIARKNEMFKKFVKSPINLKGLRLDTVITDNSGYFKYSYTQTIKTKSNTRKANICIVGEILEDGNRIYQIPESDTLSFYISSLSSFAENKTKYIHKIIERRAEANTACYIDFQTAQSDINPKMANNAEEISRIENNFASLLENKEFDLDSIIVTASCSPEGKFSYNEKLSNLRANAVSKYFQKFLIHTRDSLRNSQSIFMSLDGKKQKTEDIPNIKFIARNNPENWRMLNALVKSSKELSNKDKERYLEISQCEDLDTREHSLSKEDFYPLLRKKFYPRLRTVRFDFHLHKKAMVKDTIHTTIVDTCYMKGLDALKQHDYKLAVSILMPYQDFNTALAYCAMDYNASAIEILSKLKKTAKVNYILALAYSKKGDNKKAVEHYLKACSQDKNMISRGNLDPEICKLIKRYNLNSYFTK